MPSSVHQIHFRNEKWERGYKAPESARAFLKVCHKTRLWLTVLTALGDHALILALAAAVYQAAARLHPATAIVLYPLALAGIVRCQRGLENLVHEGSHFNWSRSNHRFNDVLCNLLAATPVFSDVRCYRPSHKLHHFSFGTAEDADLERYQILDVEGLDRRRALPFALGIARRIVTYVIGWWRVIRTRAQVLTLALVWHATVLVLPLSLILGIGPALGLWLAFWIVPFHAVLPWQRFIAETAKHQYEGRETVFDATISNVGFFHALLLHPHNDGYHLLHHLFPGIPHHQLRRAHHGLAKLDPTGYGEALRRRTHVLEEPAPARSERPGRTGTAETIEPKLASA